MGVGRAKGVEGGQGGVGGGQGLGGRMGSRELEDRGVLRASWRGEGC